MNLTQFERIKTELEHARYEENKVAGTCMRLTIYLEG
jgi:hypothetical protein